MRTQPSQERVRLIYQMLFEMATGNLSFRIPTGETNDELNALINLLNTFASTMADTISECGFVMPKFTYQSLIQSTWILDTAFSIKSFSTDLPIKLGYPPDEIFNQSFTKMLSNLSIDYWQIVATEAQNDANFHRTIQLTFTTADKKLIPSFCTVSRLLYSDKIFISTITTILQDNLADTFIKSDAPARISESAIIQNVHDYILKNLEEPLPSAKKLSKMFGTNEFKIKDGFRHFFKTSIYKFYNEERLKKAHLLIQQTDFPLKSIAFAAGFNDYTNFYKAFKKRFGYAPSDLNRNSN